ncbi:MAG: DUF4935 domain-containing protein [Saprospiraceae bacterium]|nr:DUF4935 domain-containing protein [Saprospiraceae bacterium]MBP6567238.1 DUF4935 domain-containing protein [Saprospiraceae bacterium]
MDTNVWLYLANSYNPKNKAFEDGLHFRLVEILTELVVNREIVILTNEIIIEEWNRNKEVAKNLIQKYRKSLEGNKGHFSNIKKFLEEVDKVRLDAIFENYTKNLNHVIDNNEKHIAQVEYLLLDKTEKIEITQEIKARAAERAINKLAPFKGDKSNSMADAVVLLSAIEHLKKVSIVPTLGDYEEHFYIFPNSTFVTINKGDFANPENENEIHPDLKSVLDEAKIKYEANIGKVLNAIKNELINRNELEQIELEIDEEYWKNVDYCELCFPDPEKSYVNNIIHFSELTFIDNELVEYHNPNQLKLFDSQMTVKREDEEIKKSDINTIQFGNCAWCNAQYIKCHYCGTVNHAEYLEQNTLHCEGCGLTYKFNYRNIGSGMTETEVKIIDEEE